MVDFFAIPAPDPECHMIATSEKSLSGILDRLAASILQTYSDDIRTLQIQRVSNGIILSGIADSLYGKQLALTEVRRRYPVRVVENRIIVESETLSGRKQLTEVC
jgi:cell division ATPase FtsA